MKSPWSFNSTARAAFRSASCSRTCAHVDDLCVVRSMVGEGVDHGAAVLQLHTGQHVYRPSMGSWVIYGLGTENQNLPGFSRSSRRCPMAAQKTGVPPFFRAPIRAPRSATVG